VPAALIEPRRELDQRQHLPDLRRDIGARAAEHIEHEGDRLGDGRCAGAERNQAVALENSC